jgi:uncharacterized protein (TIGR02099 family)
MKFLLRLFHIVWKTLWYSFAAVVVLTAVLFSISRMLLPSLGDYSVTVQDYFSQFVNQPIRIQSLDAEWRGWGPSLVLNNVWLLDSQGKNTIVRVSKARLGLGLWKTLKSGQLGFTSADLEGVDLSITRMPDGQITLTGFEMLNSAESPVVDNTFLEWLLMQGRIGIQFRNLLYEDRMVGGRKYFFSNVALSLRNQGDHHLMEGWVGIPKQPDQKMTLFVDAQGDLLHSDQWSGRLYVSGNQINIINLINSLTPMARKFTVGTSDFEIWSTWDKSKLQNMQGKFALQDVAIKNTAGNSFKKASNNATNETLINYQQLAGRFHWEQQAGGWKLQADQVSIKHQDRQWPDSQFQINYLKANNVNAQGQGNKNYQLTASGNFLRIQDLTPLMQLFDVQDNEIVQRVQAAKVGFDVHDFRVDYTAGSERHFDISAGIEDFHSVINQELPGIKNVSGRIRLNEHSGYFQMNSKNVIMNMPQLFRHKILLNELQGDLGWQQQQGEFFITGRNLRLRDSEFTLEALMDVELPLQGKQTSTDAGAKQGPYLNLIAQFANGDGSKVARKIPAKIMGPQLVKWLDQAIVDGHVPKGKLVFHGDVNDFPFYHHEGVFKVKFDMEDGILDYGEGWPRLENLKAQVEFNGPGLTITSNKGRILQSKVSNTIVTIPDLNSKPLLVNIKGDVDGKTQDKADYILISPPLYRKFGNFFEDVVFGGNSKLQLDVDLHISKDDVDADVNGSLKLAQNKIRYSWFGEPLTEINGQIDIVPYGIKAQAIKANFYGQPTTIDIKTTLNNTTQDSEYIQVTAKGDLDSRDLSKRYMPVLSDLVDGHSEWNVVSFIPLDDTPNPINKLPEPIRFTAESNLKEAGVRLPTPFDKQPGQPLPTIIEGMLYMDNNYVFTLDYGNRVNAIMQYSEAGEDVWRGEFRFGSGPVELPKEEGFRFVGHLPTVSADVWRSLVSQSGIGVGGLNQNTNPNLNTNPPAKSVDWSKFLHSADLTIDQFQLFGQEAKNMVLRMQGEKHSILLDVNSDELKGKIRIPYDMDRDPLVLNLDRWELTSSGEGTQSDVDPRELPAIKAFSKSVSFKNRKFGSVKLETTKIVEGLRLEQLVLKPRSTTILATGKWTKIGGEQRSDFELHLESQNLGETMDDLDYVGSISGGEGNVDVNVSWPGPLTDVAVERLQGNAAINFKNGKLLAIDSGAGRIFGLFSLQTLPKRLVLDFSDVYQKGIVFNEIAGNFSIEDGDAYTNNFYLDGPAAKAQVAGRIGLATQDYDQLLTFTPQTADIASIIGLVVATPWGFVIPQIFKENINKAMSFQYTLTGRWNNPQLEPVIKSEPADLFTE